MQQISCILIDDEPLARKGLREYIADVEFLKLAGEFDEPLKAMELLNNGAVQLVFLDIQMPKITGLDFFKTLKAIDYLVKPISFERFLKAVLRVKEFYEVRQKNSFAAGSKEDYFFIRADNKLIKVFHDDILYIEALQNYAIIHAAGRKLYSHTHPHQEIYYLPHL